MKVGRYNYPDQYGDIQVLVEDLKQMLLAGHYVLSEEVETFERDFADYLGVGHVRGVNSGTDALVIALRILGIGPGDEVITQANTFHATVLAITIAGATPVLVDADESSFLIDESQISVSITPKTRAIIPVHLYGKPTPMAKILEVAQKHEIFVVEDAAQAHGARFGGKAAGTSGSVGCFSFHPSKNLAAAGDGGAIATNSSTHAEAIDRIRALGQKSQNDHVVLGYNSKLDSLQARVLQWKLKKLEIWNESRRRIACVYREGLQGLPLVFQSVAPEETHAYHLFVVRTNHRDSLLAHLQQAGIDAVVRYPTPIHLQPAFEAFRWRAGQFPVAEILAKELLCLPIRPDMQQVEVDYVIESVRGFFSAAR